MAIFTRTGFPQFKFIKKYRTDMFSLLLKGARMGRNRRSHLPFLQRLSGTVYWDLRGARQIRNVFKLQKKAKVGFYKKLVKLFKSGYKKSKLIKNRKSKLFLKNFNVFFYNYRSNFRYKRNISKLVHKRLSFKLISTAENSLESAYKNFIHYCSDDIKESSYSDFCFFYFLACHYIVKMSNDINVPLKTYNHFFSPLVSLLPPKFQTFSSNYTGFDLLPMFEDAFRYNPSNFSILLEAVCVIIHNIANFKFMGYQNYLNSVLTTPMVNRLQSLNLYSANVVLNRPTALPEADKMYAYSKFALAHGDKSNIPAYKKAMMNLDFEFKESDEVNEKLKSLYGKK